MLPSKRFGFLQKIKIYLKKTVHCVKNNSKWIFSKIGESRWRKAKRLRFLTMPVKLQWWRSFVRLFVVAAFFFCYKAYSPCFRKNVSVFPYRFIILHISSIVNLFLPISNNENSRSVCALISWAWYPTVHSDCSK